MISKLINILNRIKIFPYYIITPIVYAVGTASEEILVGAKKARNLNKKILIIFPTLAQNYLNYNICNEFLSTHLILNNFKQANKKNLKKIIQFFVNIEMIIMRIIILVFKNILSNQTREKLKFPRIGINFSYSNDNINHNNLRNKSFDDISPLNISNEKIDLIYDENYLSKLNAHIKFDFNDPYVCLQVRDSAFYNDSNRKNYRNSNIENYYELINFLVSKNYKVIRMGSKVHNPIKIKNKNIIDYPYSEFYNKYLDLLFMKNCNFYIGTSSGLIDVAWLFNRPVLLTNMINIFSGLPRNKCDRGIFKKIFNKNGRMLTLKEYMRLPFSFHNLDKNINDLSFEENSSEELYLAVSEFVDILDKENFSLNQKQKIFNSQVNENLNKLFADRNDIDCLVNYHACLNMLRITKSCKGSLSSFYLDKYL